VVSSDRKHRYEYSNDRTKLRATQGHTIKSINTEDLLAPISEGLEYELVIHGTEHKYLNSIMVGGGLSKMTRNHIHFAKGKNVLSGMPVSTEAVIEINLVKAIARGIKFFISANGVILTEGINGGYIPCDFFRKITDHRTEKILFKAKFDYICVLDEYHISIIRA
jgi:2'-phosphotransferase